MIAHLQSTLRYEHNSSVHRPLHRHTDSYQFLLTALFILLSFLLCVPIYYFYLYLTLASLESFRFHCQCSQKHWRPLYFCACVQVCFCNFLCNCLRDFISHSFGADLLSQFHRVATAIISFVYVWYLYIGIIMKYSLVSDTLTFTRFRGNNYLPLLRWVWGWVEFWLQEGEVVTQ